MDDPSDPTRKSWSDPDIALLKIIRAWTGDYGSEIDKDSPRFKDALGQLALHAREVVAMSIPLVVRMTADTLKEQGPMEVNDAYIDQDTEIRLLLRDGTLMGTISWVSPDKVKIVTPREKMVDVRKSNP